MNGPFESRRWTALRAAVAPAAAAIAFILALGEVSASSVPAHAALPVDCSRMDIDFVDSPANKSCEAGAADAVLWHGTAQTMVVRGKGYFVWIRRLKADPDSFLEPEDVDVFTQRFPADAPKYDGFKEVHEAVSGYAIALFGGRLDSGGLAGCFAFLRLSGRDPADGSFSIAPGYAHGVYGAYCRSMLDPISDAEISHVLGALYVAGD